MAAASGVALMSASRSDGERDLDGHLEDMGQAAAGTMFLLTGALLIVVGALLPSGDGGEQAQAPQRGDDGAIKPSSPPGSASAIVEQTPSKRASQEAVEDRLMLHIRLAARANRCGAADEMMKKLGVLDQSLLSELVHGDEHVARCASNGMSLHAPS